MNFTGFYRVLLGFTGFYWVLLGLTGFYWVLLDFTGFYWVLLGFTGFYWVLLSLSLSLCSQLVRHLLWRRVFFLARWWESTKAPPAACRYHIGVGYCQATHSDAGDGQAKTEKKNLTFEPPPKNKTNRPGARAL